MKITTSDKKFYDRMPVVYETIDGNVKEGNVFYSSVEIMDSQNKKVFCFYGDDVDVLKIINTETPYLF